MRARGSKLQVIADEINRIENEAAREQGLPLPKPRSASTISSELRRNKTKRGKYNLNTANEMAKEKRERVVRNTASAPGCFKRH